jgi:hypothetical protein
VAQRVEEEQTDFETAEQYGTDHDLPADKKQIHRYTSAMVEQRGKGHARQWWA